ncbi:hypothetical protein INT48_003325 [Thamnidium elegans]|uniref:Uncharacterized protein n=1 Tax=Thamnidium elegans TaxID=101142 RepID=A0A8H7SM18_9FUNG|nr:hypothetical protein INT48_003325 [Thamnidium elegans]
MLVRFNDGKKSLFTASLGVAIGDIPACADLCGHVSHQAYYGYLACRAKATRYKGTMCYLPTHQGNLEELMREDEDFKEGDKANEMHFWGPNVGGKIWSIITDDGKKYQGPTQQNKHSFSSNGSFLDVYRKSGHFRKQLRNYESATNIACNAIVCLSKVCKITQKYSISESNLVELNCCIEVWQEFLVNNFYPNVFTINMHYLNHIREDIATLGPLRLVSTRPLERMIGSVKSSIKSRQKPSENAKIDKCVVFGKEITKQSCRSLVERFHECTEANEAAIKTTVSINQEARLIESYFPIRSGKELKLTGKPSRKGSFIFYCARVDEEISSHRCMEATASLKHGQLIFMYNTENTNFALVKTIFPAKYNAEQDCHYFYKNDALTYAFEVINIPDVVSYGIETTTLNEQDIERINLVWDRF